MRIRPMQVAAVAATRVTSGRRRRHGRQDRRTRRGRLRKQSWSCGHGRRTAQRRDQRRPAKKSFSCTGKSTRTSIRSRPSRWPKASSNGWRPVESTSNSTVSSPDGDPASTATLTRRTTATWVRPPRTRPARRTPTAPRLRQFWGIAHLRTIRAELLRRRAGGTTPESSPTWVERGRGLARTTPSRDAGRLCVGERDPVPVTPAATHAQIPAGDRPTSRASRMRARRAACCVITTRKCWHAGRSAAGPGISAPRWTGLSPGGRSRVRWRHRRLRADRAPVAGPRSAGRGPVDAVRVRAADGQLLGGGLRI